MDQNINQSSLQAISTLIQSGALKKSDILQLLNSTPDSQPVQQLQQQPQPEQIQSQTVRTTYHNEMYYKSNVINMQHFQAQQQQQQKALASKQHNLNLLYQQQAIRTMSSELGHQNDYLQRQQEQREINESAQALLSLRQGRKNDVSIKSCDKVFLA